MAIYRIVLYGDEILRQKCPPVTKINRNILKLLDNMRDTMYDARGVGLAAPQVGVPKRVIVVDTGDGLVELINPEITDAQGEETDVEGCLSFPDLVGDVTRAQRVRVRGLNRHGEEVTYEATGYQARAFQHEIDHLDGILFIDRATNIRKLKPGRR